jgi:hypothetical protein
LLRISLQVAISHCGTQHFTERERGLCPFAACQGLFRNQTNGVHSAKAFAAQHRLLLIDVCAILRSLLEARCSRAWTGRHGWPQNETLRFTALYTSLYNYFNAATRAPCRKAGSAAYKGQSGVDRVHFGPGGDQMLGCVIGKAVAQAVARDEARALPARDRSPTLSGDARQSATCMAQDGFGAPIVPTQATDWRVVDPKPNHLSKSDCMDAGGAAAAAEKEKSQAATVWRAMRPGATMVVRLPPAHSIFAEFYHHHSLQMGTALFSGTTWSTSIDTCCPHHCLGNALPGQGFTYRRLVAQGLDGTAGGESVTITALPSNASSCRPADDSRYQLDLFGLIAVDEETSRLINGRRYVKGRTAAC